MSKLPAIPAPGSTLGGVSRTVLALKQAVETLGGLRGPKSGWAFTWADFKAAGLDTYKAPEPGRRTATVFSGIYPSGNPADPFILAVPHNLGTKSVVVSVANVEDGVMIPFMVTADSAQTVSLRFEGVVPAQKLRVTVIG